ncbi:hypothetical protein RI578_13470 [Streptomyces sp. BB1-1-1]|uniref:hypothetical protein n=1 Tax=Streptomyces sp. BB1-1-1 TaxID=3074430 RepID=UPI0028779DA2|nr:hypothetical protein [Streptomyces sp. BB1-1-1]WND35235.1 hypothetical protein RI578_13470 [Streptomyces sp. BB1-1-1]
MSISKNVGKILVGGVAVVALSGVGSAYAGGAGENLYSTTTGASTWSDEPNSSVAVKDKAVDGDAVYSLYDRRYNTGKRLDNGSGEGTTVYSSGDFTNYISKVTACVNLNNTPDRCGPDDRPGDGR